METSEIGLMALKTGGMFLVVIAALLALLFLMRRLSTFRGVRSGKHPIQVEAMHHFSPRERVALVTVRGRTLLLGVTPQSITCLAGFGGSEEAAGARTVEAEARKAETARPEGFRELMKRSVDAALSGETGGESAVRGGKTHGE
jgi:flagellar protein FliO/FliZ